jgi:hypothetical protein
MKCKAFASPLEAYVGQSPVRGGKAIKTDRNTSNNLNQLLSRVKTIFGRKATSAANTPLEAEPSIGIASVSDPRLSAAFADIEKYLAENYGTPTAKLRYKDYTNGASLVSEDSTFYLSLAILTEPDGLYNLPDNVMLLVAVTSTNDTDWLTEELGKLIVFLRELGSTHRIQHLALAFSKDKLDHPATVQTADVTCVRLY